MRGPKGTAKVLYHADKTYATGMDNDFVQIWSKLIVPHEADLPRELEKAGLKSMEVFEKKVAAEAIKKGKKTRRGMRVKMTNTHIEGLDLTQDFVKSDGKSAPVPEKAGVSCYTAANMPTGR